MSEGGSKKNGVKIYTVASSISDFSDNITLSSEISFKESKEQIIGKAISFHLNGNISEAVKHYQYCIKNGLIDYRVFTNYGVILNDIGKSKEAEILFRKAIDLDPTKENAYYNLANVFRSLNRLKDAEIYIRKAIEIRPNFAEAHLSLANILRDLGKFNESEISLCSAIKFKPDFAEAHLNLGNIMRDLGKLDEALISVRKSIDIKPGFAEAHLNLANILMDLGQLNNSEISTRKAIQYKPNYADAFCKLGNIFKEQGKYDEAILSYNKASKLEPKNPKYYSIQGLKVSDFYRENLLENIDLINIIENCDWENSKKLLEKICRNIPKYTKDYVNEFIKLWCDFGKKLVDQSLTDNLLPIFIQLIIINERNEDIIDLSKYIFKKYDLNKLLGLLDEKDKFLLILGYCEYKYTINKFSEVENLSCTNIQKSMILISDNETEDIGWLVTRRSLALFKENNLARKALINLINTLPI
ncbi:tetratricopeptide repeat protein [Prochlorococcus sp. MIT 0801]|uniref:tetratricopeptide repeat protein n=1 Tax=Prochlorococcus sp. MIT 0801 TaxID=1501269 RepID=UPI0004F6BBA8|nr:tetratricopeptide repeat protein [Prochlorococcus sp. MIT 0801]AIQ97403.1 TPR domain protein [Prochlorococcus sp. MIT 0801]